jgi:N-acetylmuramoyl-L-alanine amidase
VLTLAPASGPARAEILPLHVTVNGQPEFLIQNAINQNGVIMVPYQGLFEPMGIRATWDALEQTLTLSTPAGDEMQLRPNDPYATVNGERRPIPIPLVTVLGQTLIPVQWVLGTLGALVVYEPADQHLTIDAQITGITWRATDGGLEVTIDGTAPLHARVSTLRSPDRLVVDVLGAIPKLPQRLIDVHEGAISTIHLGESAAGARIVFDLTSPVQYHLPDDPPSRGLVIGLESGPPAASGSPAGTAGYMPSAQKITDIAYEHLDGGGRLIVVSTQPLHAAEQTLRHPDRIVLDVQDAVFIPVKKSLDVDDGLVVQIRAAQFHKNPNIVRIVVELTRPAPYAIRAGTDAGQTLVDLGTVAAGGPLPGRRGTAVVAVDAGHGGSDPGAIGPTDLQEKDVALAIAQDLRAMLVQQHIQVIMVRDSDVFVPLEDRARIAAQAGATLFVSIHANASVDANANGTQTFYATPQSIPLATAVQDEVSRATGVAPRGVMQARFEVLVDNPRIPAILVETAFITNPREEQLLRDPSMQQTFAQGILRGIMRYLTAPPSAASQ